MRQNVRKSDYSALSSVKKRKTADKMMAISIFIAIFAVGNLKTR